MVAPHSIRIRRKVLFCQAGPAAIDPAAAAVEAFRRTQIEFYQRAGVDSELARNLAGDLAAFQGATRRGAPGGNATQEATQ